MRLKWDGGSIYRNKLTIDPFFIGKKQIDPFRPQSRFESTKKTSVAGWTPHAAATNFTTHTDKKKILLPPRHLPPLPAPSGPSATNDAVEQDRRPRACRGGGAHHALARFQNPGREFRVLTDCLTAHASTSCPDGDGCDREGRCWWLPSDELTATGERRRQDAEAPAPLGC
jgi:hypothetical protein